MSTVLTYSRAVDPDLPLTGLDSARSDEGEVTLKLCVDALKALFRQSHDQSTDFLDKLGQCRISKVITYNLEPVGTSDCNQARFAELCEAIGQSSIQAATLHLSRSWTLAHAVLFQHLQHITTLDIVGFFDGNISPDFVGSLSRHPCLETIALLKWEIPQPKINNPSPFGPETSRRNMPVLSDLLGLDRDLTVKITDNNFRELQSSPSFNDAVATARVKHIEIINCNVGATVPFAEALAKSQVRGLRVATLHFDDDGKSLSWSYDQVAKRLPRMQCLEEIMFEEMNRSPRAATAFTRMAARCVLLKRLTINTRSYFATFDQALADCVKSNQLLEYIEFDAGNYRHEVEHFPYLVDALKMNVSLQNFRFGKYNQVFIPRFTSESSLQRFVNVICRLNRSGRAYMKSEPANRNVSNAVIAAVCDDFDCVLFHVRENPMICEKGYPA